MQTELFTLMIGMAIIFMLCSMIIPQSRAAEKTILSLIAMFLWAGIAVQSYDLETISDYTYVNVNATNSTVVADQIIEYTSPPFKAIGYGMFFIMLIYSIFSFFGVQRETVESPYSDELSKKYLEGDKR